MNKIAAYLRDAGVFYLKKYDSKGIFVYIGTGSLEIKKLLNQSE